MATTPPSKLPSILPALPADSVLAQEGATGKGLILDSNNPSQTGDGHWLRQGKKTKKDESK